MNFLSKSEIIFKQKVKMSAKGVQTAFFRASALIILVSMVVTVILGSQDHDVPVSVDGLRCDSCGSECSAMCGSRNFRTCCYNYIKKRSIPWPSTGGSNSATGENTEEENQESKTTSPVSGTDIKSSSVVGTSIPVKSPILIPHSHQQGLGSGKHIFRGYLPEIVGGDSIEEGTYLYPMTLRDLMTTMIRTLNAFENRKFGRMVF